jgi:hypothetical protein
VRDCQLRQSLTFVPPAQPPVPILRAGQHGGSLPGPCAEPLLRVPQALAKRRRCVHLD